MSRRGRLPMLVAAALASAAAVAAAILSWPRLLEEYRLLALRRDPGLLEEFLLAEGSARERAAASFVREPAGKAALLRLYLEELDKGEASFNFKDFLLRLPQSPYREGTVALSESGAAVESLSPPKGRHIFTYACVPVHPRRRRHVLELLEGCAGSAMRVPSFEGFEFQIERIEGGKAPGPAWREPTTVEWSSSDPGLRYLCFFRVLGPPR